MSLSQKSTDSRQATAVDDLAENYFAKFMDLNPLLATYLGVDISTDQMPDLTPEGLASLSDLRRETLTQLGDVESVDKIDRVTTAALRSSLEVEEDLREAGCDEALLRNVASPVQDVRDVFDLMPRTTTEDWEIIASRLGHVQDALEGYAASLRSAAQRGNVASQRQIEATSVQARHIGATSGYFEAMVEESQDVLPAPLLKQMQTQATRARTSYVEFADFLESDLAPMASAKDAVGQERYALHSRALLGSQIDLEDTYAWGQEELARIENEMDATAQRIRPGQSARQTIHDLTKDPNYLIHDRDEFVAWMQSTSDAALEALDGVYFDIPEPLRRIECLISTSGKGSITYTPPSENFARPGRMWWDLPVGVDSFSPWLEMTTVHHEGVPGHHLQAASAMYNRAELNRWRRFGSWVSGHGEGWAQYAERLMAELGFLDDDANYLGMLDNQSVRAARVVLDIGIHCEFEAPAEVGGGRWDFDKAWKFLSAHASRNEKSLQFEITRYLGWPGQAASYKVGERLWLDLRARAAAEQGSAFSLKQFHTDALKIGSVGLDVLRDALHDRN